MDEFILKVHYGYVERRGNVVSPIHDIAIVTLDRDITRFVLFNLENLFNLNHFL